jgi:glucose/arabinose dehydrogenase
MKRTARRSVAWLFAGLVVAMVSGDRARAVEDPPGLGPHPALPAPFATPSAIRYCKAVDWPKEKTPVAPPGFTVTLYADGLDYPRWIYVLPNGDVLVAPARTKPKPDAGSADDQKAHQKKLGSEQSKSVGEAANRITLLRDANHDGVPETRTTFLDGLNQPMGMLLLGDTSVNERDELVPDYITSVTEGGFYGWPWSYYGQHQDPRHEGEHLDLVKKALVPDYAVGNHTASLGLLFHRGGGFPAPFADGAFVGQHGSWNRSTLNGYEVLYVPFAHGRPSGQARDFLTGFIADRDKREVYGRPVGLAALPDGSLLVADDAGNRVWRVAAAKQR